MVPDSAFSGFGPLGGLITLDFKGFRAHLSLVETPAGLLTTVGVLGTFGEPHFDVIGTWILGNGTPAAGSANDMVAAGLVHVGAPASVGILPIAMNPIFPTVPFGTDPTPFTQEETSNWRSVGIVLRCQPGRSDSSHLLAELQDHRCDT